MDKRVLKYPLEREETQVVEIPVGAVLLSAIEQKGGVSVYAIVPSGVEETVAYEFTVLPTGGEFSDTENVVVPENFLSTVQVGSAVVHVFYRQVEKPEVFADDSTAESADQQ